MATDGENDTDDSDVLHNVTDKLFPSKTKGDVMIFLGKHIIHLMPESKSTPSNFPVTKMEQTTTYVNKTKNFNINKKKTLNKPRRYSIVQNQPLNQTVKTSMNNATKQQKTATLAPLSTKEANTTHQAIYFLPYSKRHNQIHFFDFAHEFDKKSDWTSEDNEEAVNNGDSEGLHKPFRVKSITRLLPLVVSKLTDADIQLSRLKLNHLTSDQSLFVKWLRYILRKHYDAEHNQPQTEPTMEE